MINQILLLLGDIEQEYDIKILFAVESGSRLWGFHSKDSDYDIRFVYSRPINHYIGLRSQYSDTINKITEDRKFDLSGWDIKKFCQLYIKSNPSTIEWLESNIIYMGQDIIDIFKPLNPHIKLRPLYEHYRSLAKQNYMKYIKDNLEPQIKKYLYVMRAIFNSYLVVYNQTPILPSNFEEVLFIFKCRFVGFAPIIEIVDDIITKKKFGNEIMKQYKLNSLNEFIEYYFGMVNKHREAIQEKQLPNSFTDRIDEIFLDLIGYNESQEGNHQE